jgi:two-component system, NtrC family, sensor kinase
MTAQIKEKAQTLALLYDFPAMIWSCGPDGQCVYINGLWLEFRGSSADEEIGNGWTAGLHPDDIDNCLDALKKSCSLKCGIHVEYRLQNSELDYRWISHIGQPFFDSHGAFSGLLCICHDITENKQTQETLKLSEEYFRSFIESSQDCIAHLSRDGNFLSMNDAGVKLYGLESAGDIIGVSFLEIVVHGRERVEEAIQRAADGESVSIRFMSRNRSSTDVWWDTKLTPVIDHDGTIRSILLLARDITDQKRAEEALNLKNVELQNAYAELKAAQSRILQQEKLASVGQLAAGIAHEINNPMGFIISNINTLLKYTDRIWEYVDLLKHEMDGQGSGHCIEDSLKLVEEKKKSLKIDYIREDVNNLITESLEGAERVKKIVQDLKSFSRLDESEYKPADINAGIESTINIVWNELKYKVTLIREYGDIPFTKCNLGQLNQVFMNILINAAQAIESQGEIKIKTWSEQNFIHIFISDTGRGISQEHLKRIFEPFFTTKDVGKGTGLGLSIAYDIVKKHNGEIHVESEVGKGTAFTIIIPVVEG